MSGRGEFQAQISSIMEVLVNAAVAEICRVVDDGIAVVHLEMSHSHKENEFLRRKIKLLELQISRFREERVKFSDRHGRDPQAAGRVQQSRDSSLSRNSTGRDRDSSLSRNSTGRDSNPVHLHQDPVTICEDRAKNETASPKQEDELDLLIVKVEGATGADHPASSRNSERPPRGDRELSSSSSARQWDDPAIAAGRNLTEGLDSEAGEEQRLEGGSDHDGGDHDINLHAEVKSEVIVIDALPVGGDNDHSDFPPSSLWSPGDMGGWRSEDGANQNAVHHGSQSRLYGYDPRLQNAAAPVAVPTGDQHPVWAELQENPTGLFSSHSPNPPTPLGSEPRPYKCAFCLRQYSHQCQLRIHERVHTGEKPYQCSQCGKQFGQFCSLKRHQRVHTGEKPYQCSQCGKQFSHSNNLKVHQSVHTGEKRFHCNQCGKNFSFLSNLIRHQTVHAAGK